MTARPDPPPPTLDYAGPVPRAWPANLRWAVAAYVFAGLGLMVYVGLVRDVAPSVSYGFFLPLFAVASLLSGVGAFVVGRRADGDVRARRHGYLALAIGLGVCLSLAAAVVIAMNHHRRAHGLSPGFRCSNNLRQIGQGLLVYANENKGRYPPTLDPIVDGDEWVDPKCFVCPDTADTPARGPTTRAVQADFRSTAGHCSYVYLGAGRTSAVHADFILAHEPLKNHRGLGMNVLYGDGHSDWLDAPDARYVLSELAASHNPPRPKPVPAAAQPSTRPGD